MYTNALIAIHTYNECYQIINTLFKLLIATNPTRGPTSTALGNSSLRMTQPAQRGSISPQITQEDDDMQPSGGHTSTVEAWVYTTQPAEDGSTSSQVTQEDGNPQMEPIRAQPKTIQVWVQLNQQKVDLPHHMSPRKTTTHRWSPMEDTQAQPKEIQAWVRLNQQKVDLLGHRSPKNCWISLALMIWLVIHHFNPYYKNIWVLQAKPLSLPAHSLHQQGHPDIVVRESRVALILQPIKGLLGATVRHHLGAKH